jgi:Flp pilus assembly protein TadD
MDAGRPDEGMKFYRDLLELDPTDWEIMYRLAVVYEDLGRFEDALTLLETILSNEVDNREVMQKAVSTALRAGMVSKALAYINRWLRLYPNDQTVLDAKKMIEDQIRQNNLAPDSTP